MYRFNAPLLLLLVAWLAAGTRLAHAEGTKQLCPEDTDVAGLIINNGNYGNFGGYGGPATSRMLLTIANPGSERVYLGFARATTGTDFAPGNAGEIDSYFRIVDPNGNVVFGPQLISGTGIGSLTTHAQAVAGPINTGGAGGYLPFTFEPAAGAVAGDYVIEFSNRAGELGPDAGFNYPLFDITVATRTAAPTPIPGRLYSKNWAIIAPPNPANQAIYANFNRQFRGTFHVYSPRGFVSKVDFLEAGFRPYIFNISFNENGTSSGPNVLENIKSVDGALATNPVHKVFLSDPDNDSYPNGTYGTILNNASYPKLIGCAGSGDYSIRVAVTKPGVVEVLFDQDQTSTSPGTYDAATADRLLMYTVEPEQGEQAPYVRDLPWDGLDGQGNDITGAPTLNVETTYGQVAYHLPIYDAEYMTDPNDDGDNADAGGFAVTLTRPVPPDGYTVQMQYDDSAITEEPGDGSPKVQLEGCAPPCHRWSVFEFGNENTINTFWYARRQFIFQTLALEALADCTVPSDIAISGVAYDDTDNSFAREDGEASIEGVNVSLYRDENRNGLIDAGETALETTATDADGAYAFNTVVPVSTVTTSLQIPDAGSDGMDYSEQNRWYPNIHSIGDFNGVAGAFTGGLRFDGLGIPKGATISSATLTLVSRGRFRDTNPDVDFDITIAGIDQDAPAAFSNTNRPSALPVTDATASFTAPANWENAESLYTTDVLAVLQEVTARGGYENGNPIALRLSGAGSEIQFYGFEDDPTKAPVLTVTYTSPELPVQYIVRVDPSTAPAGFNLVSNRTQTSAFQSADGRDQTGEFRFARDRDGDGIADVFDIDNDNDGTPDAEEDGGTGINPTADADGDGIPNYQDTDGPAGGVPDFVDSNNDGVNDVYDYDLDGVPDVFDLDSDNDGITDLVEAGGTDTNGDGAADDLTDADGDGLVDSYDNNDTDGPIGSGVDLTSPATSSLSDPDRDGVANLLDSDGDGIPDSRDLDSDNDGIADLIEAGGTDADGDGKLDIVVDGTTDADRDGLADAIDGDTDNDGTAENSANALVVTGADTDGDGRPESYPVANTDGDLLPAFRDRDSDGDGIADAVEAGAIDANGDGVADGYNAADADGLNDNYAGANALNPADTDRDGKPDYLDLDADGDGIADAVEAGATDANGDGLTDNFVDADNDGLNDVYDADPTNALAAGNDTAGANNANALAEVDTDGDGIVDYLDLDSDNDGVADATEAGGPTADANGDGLADDTTDADGDGLADAYTLAAASVRTGPDANGDGAPDSYATGDADGDGYPNHLDLDSDNDGLTDVLEAGGTDADGDGRVDTTTDTDRDGLADVVDPSHDGPASGTTAAPAAGTPPANGDTDGDGLADAVDLDSDNDGIADIVEAGGTDTNNDGRTDDATDTDQDGLADVVDLSHDGPAAGATTAPAAGTPLANGDTDGDGITDALDLDSDNDGIADIVEAGGTDADGDGRGDDATDTDQDGLANAVDVSHDGPAAATTTAPAAGSPLANGDADGDGLADAVDLDSDNDGLTDILEAGGTDTDGDGRVDDGTDADRDGLANAVDPSHDGPSAGTTTAPAAGSPLANDDADGDGLANAVDLDSDGDGLTDLTEAGGSDTDGDGRVDADTDADADGLADVYDPYNDATQASVNGVNPLAKTDATGAPVDAFPGQRPDLDGDSFANWLDRDTDNDGLFDLHEAAGANLDADNDGRIDQAAGYDADADGLADAVDTDVSDGPGTGGATAGTALASAQPDANGNGLAEDGYTQPALNPDGDGFVNYRDLDSDDDGITDVVEQNAGSASTDGATRDGRMEANTGTDWTLNRSAAPLDSDNDGLPDYLDIDADNDGIADQFESVCSTCPTAASFSASDANENGVDDFFEGLDADNAKSGSNVGVTPVNIDGANGLDYLDTDSDGDTFPDWSEGFDDDGDGQAKNELEASAAAYESDNGNPGRYTTADADSDGIPDWMDNVDGPGYDEAQRPPYLDPTSAFWFDANGNGMADLVDATGGGTAATRPDQDNANDRDWRDAGTNAVLPVELLSFAVSATANCQADVSWSGVEVDFSHYAVEVSGDGERFEQVATLAATNAAGVVSYSTRVPSEAGVSYYRLLLADGDGSVSYSNIVSVTASCGANSALRVFPNPAHSGGFVNVAAGSATTLRLQRFTGQVIRTVAVEAGQTIQVSLANLPEGIYTLTGDTGQSTRIIVQ